MYKRQKLDGAGHFRRFWQIVLPLVRPMIAVQALWAFMGPFGDYILSKFLLRDEVNYTAVSYTHLDVYKRQGPQR